ncbi:Chloroperoxidase [Acrodontium crateriforme]|uniref:Chloroperoxidase n=1 Tax=Acrodontium crateriforme TaxID=150365 RepID=A0AAQ3R798_9PEZI|nr:Chloroperoxidase [Acrodontium crateriforme]
MLSAILPLVFSALALASDADTHPFVPPGPGDVRSPCPALNSLANHGFLPHSGQGITVPQFVQALKDGLNVGAQFATVAGTAALASNPTLFGATSVDLNMLDEHNFPIEHDCSLSRKDAYFGDDHTFDQDTFNQVLAYFDGSEVATIPAASKGRYHRVQQSMATNPELSYGALQFVLSYGETALYLSVLDNPLRGNPPVSYVKSFFENETLPYNLGWTKPEIEVDFETLQPIITELILANGEVIPEGLTLDVGTLISIWELKDPITGKLRNTTCALLGLC